MKKKIIALLAAVLVCCSMALPTFADYDVYVDNVYSTLPYSALYGFDLFEAYGVKDGVYLRGYGHHVSDFYHILNLVVYKSLDGSDWEQIAVVPCNLPIPEYPDGLICGFELVAPVTEVGTYFFRLDLQSDKYPAETIYTVSLTVDEVSPTPTPTPTPTPVVPDEPDEPDLPVDPTPVPTPYPHGIGREDLEGSEGVVDDAVGLLDSIYDMLPDLNDGVLGFMGGLMQLLPGWFIAAVTFSLVLSVFVIFVRFLWQ